MGGFAFEPEGPRSGTWCGFPSAHLIVPRLQMASDGGECWVTISAIVGMDGEPDVAPEELAGLYRTVLTAPTAETTAPTDSRDTGFTYSSPIGAAAWRALVGTAVEAIHAGALRKVVLAREVHAVTSGEVDVFAMLRHLRAAHRDCFVFGYWRGERAFVGASPERLVRLDGCDVRASSLAGSARRGATPEEDAALASALLASTKDRAEHAAVREALCEGLAELCDDVTAAAEPSLFTLRHVHHLHTAVGATLHRGHSLLDVVARLHPTPAVGGTPREAALQFVRRHEQLDRGWYAAPIGWVGRRSGEFAVALRSAVLTASEATLFAGCGIVADSDPELELAESTLKLRPIQAALAAALVGAPSGSSRVSVGAGQIP
jgi:isochorismate synthase